MQFVAEGKERLDRFLARMLPDVSRSRLTKHIDSAGVQVNEETVTKSGFQLKAGFTVDVDEIPASEPHDLTPVAMDLDIAFEDEHLLIVNKPRGLTVHPASSEKSFTLVNALLARSHDLSSVGGDFRPGIVHRLDKETSGLMMVAKSDVVHRKLSELIQGRKVDRRYLAIVAGSLDNQRFTVNAPIGRDPAIPSRMSVQQSGKKAVTHIQVLKQAPAYAVVSCRLETGRTHQIRVHLSHFQHPVKGDRIYASGDWADGPMQLHACSLCFDHPITGEQIVAFKQAPSDFVDGTDIGSEVATTWT